GIRRAGAGRGGAGPLPHQVDLRRAGATAGRIAIESRHRQQAGTAHDIACCVVEVVLQSRGYAMTHRIDRPLALAAFAGFVIAALPAAATAQSYAPTAPGGYANSVFAPVLRDDDASSGVESPRLRRQLVDYATREAPGTIVIDTPNTYLYLVLGNGKARRYGIGVGARAVAWSG